MVKLLLKFGADPNLQDNEGETPLFKAVKWHHHNIVKTLLEAGADFNLPNNDGVTPKMIAIEDDDTYVVDLMEQYGPQIKEPAEY